MKKILFATCILFVSGFFLSACTSSDSSYPYSSYEDGITNEEHEDEPITSDNWNCTDDCSGHEAGYTWAEEKGIDDPSDCGGNSDSFIEGCQAYANEQSVEVYEDDLIDEEYDYNYY